MAPPRLRRHARRLEGSSGILGLREEGRQRGLEWDMDADGSDQDQGDELVVLLVVPGAKAGDVVAGIEVDTVGIGNGPDSVDVSGVGGQIGVAGMVD